MQTGNEHRPSSHQVSIACLAQYVETAHIGENRVGIQCHDPSKVGHQLPGDMMQATAASENDQINTLRRKHRIAHGVQAYSISTHQQWVNNT